MRATALTCVVLLTLAVPVAAEIDTSGLEDEWPRQRVREFEVGRYPVQWRQLIRKDEGLFAAAAFYAPLDRDTVWTLTGDFREIGKVTPGVEEVRVLEHSETRSVIEMDVDILWKSLTLIFEVEREPPEVMRFRLTNARIGEYVGVCRLIEAPGQGPNGMDATAVTLTTRLRPARPIPLGVLGVIQKMTLLKTIRGFLEDCDNYLVESQAVNASSDDDSS